MLALYITSLIIGGGLLIISLLSGGETGEAGGPGGGGLEGTEAGSDGSLGSALPLASLFFWTFFLAFFGLTGVLLSILAREAGALLTACLSAGVGLSAGLIAARVLRRLGRAEVDSSVRPDDLVGQLGRVVVPVGREQLGKVRVELKGRTVELLAYSDTRVPLAPAHRVLVHDVLKDGLVRVISAEEPRGLPPPVPVS
jgi:membrane protein implicated in regulation of membrane protease activity